MHEPSIDVPQPTRYDQSIERQQRLESDRDRSTSDPIAKTSTAFVEADKRTLTEDR